VVQEAQPAGDTVARWPPVALLDIEGADDADAAVPLR
jgi:hypothetical protein